MKKSISLFISIYLSNSLYKTLKSLCIVGDGPNEARKIWLRNCVVSNIQFGKSYYATLKLPQQIPMYSSKLDKSNDFY